MLKINKLKIDIIDENGEKWGNSFVFPEKLVAFIGENTIGKSTIINSIYYSLGMEELLGYRDSRALKPVLRDKIVVNKGKKEPEKEVKVKDSFVFLEIENIKKEKITLRRSIKSSENISEGMISVYYGSLEEINILNKKDYFLKKGSATSEYGFYQFLENFLELSLPQVLSYDENKKIKLYLQNIFSAFFIEQVGGWSDLLETIPTYYKIIHPKRRVIEFILGLEYHNIILKKAELSAKKKDNIEKLKEIFNKIKISERKSFISIEGLNKNYKEYDIKNIKLYMRSNDNEILPLTEYLNKLNHKLNSIKSSNYFNNSSENDVDELREKIEKIQDKLIINQKIERNLQEELLNLNYQKESLMKEINEISKEIKNFKDIEKLNKLGSEQGIEIKKCPYCNNELSETLYPTSIQIMSIEENIKYLEEKEKIVTLAQDINSKKIENENERLRYLKKEMVELFKQLNILNNDLPKIAIQKDLFNQEIYISRELEYLIELKKELNEDFNELNQIIKEIKACDDELEKLPEDNFTEKDKEILKKFEKTIIENLKLLEITANNFEHIKISKETYFPEIQNFNIKLHISASDFIRLEWSYYISLVENSIFNKNILIFDEPAQQNVDIKSIKKLFEILNSLDKTQAIVSYAVSKENEKEMVEFFNKNGISYILINESSIKKLDN